MNKQKQLENLVREKLEKKLKSMRKGEALMFARHLDLFRKITLEAQKELSKKKND